MEMFCIFLLLLVTAIYAHHIYLNILRYNNLKKAEGICDVIADIAGLDMKKSVRVGDIFHSEYAAYQITSENPIRAVLFFGDTGSSGNEYDASHCNFMDENQYTYLGNIND